MANTLPTTMEYFDNLLGEQLTDGGGSGGGSSDFSTAKVTIIGHNDARGFLPPSFPYVADNNTSVTMGVQEENSHIYTVVLYKGSAWGVVRGADTIAMTGGVELSQDEEHLTVTGDGTLTIKPID